MWVKATCCNSSLSSFNKKLSFTIFLYWFSLIPVRRLLPAKGYNILSFSSFSWKGATTALALVLADVQYVGADLQKVTTFSFLLGTTFHKFSDWIHRYKEITPTIQSLTLNHPITESLKPCHQNTVTKTRTRAQNSATTTRTNIDLKYQIS